MPRRRPRKPRQTLFFPKIGQFATAGFVLICDIVGFLQMDPTPQKDAVIRLFTFIEQEELLKPKYDGHVNGTGDGALLAWSQRGSVVVAHAQLLDFAQKLLAHMRGATKPIPMRVGIHVGQFRTVELASKRLGIQLVGTGLNECARVSSLGSKDHVVVSEDFLKHWRKAGNFEESRFHPPDNDDPIVVFVKHDEPLSIRQDLFGESGHSLAPRLLKVLSVDALIWETLAKIEGAFVWITLDPTNKFRLPLPNDKKEEIEHQARKLSARVSIFSPLQMQRGPRKLCVTEYRYHREPIWCRKPGTEYVVDGSQQGEGPLAKAFVNGVEVLHKLSRDKEKYINEMAAAGIDRAKVEKMNRKARSYLAFSFGLPYVPDPISRTHRYEPDGVICIDLEDGLEEYDTEKLRIHAMELKNFFNTTLSALWRLRITKGDHNMTDEKYAQSIGESIGRAVACMRTSKPLEPSSNEPPTTHGSIVFSHLRNRAAAAAPRAAEAEHPKHGSTLSSE